MKDNPNLPARSYYSLAQAAIELDCPQDYLIHSAYMGRLKLMTTPPPNLLYRARVVQWERDIKSFTVLDWTMLCLEFVLLEAAPLRLIERLGELEISNIAGEWADDEYSILRALIHESESWPPSVKKQTLMIDISLPGSEGEEGSWEPPPPDERTGIIVTKNDLWVPGEEVERLKRGEPAEPTQKIPPDIAAAIHRVPGKKSVNAWLNTIAALSHALVGGLSGKPHKDAGIVLKALGEAGIAPPVLEDALARYLKEAGPVEKKDKG